MNTLLNKSKDGCPVLQDAPKPTIGINVTKRGWLLGRCVLDTVRSQMKEEPQLQAELRVIMHDSVVEVVSALECVLESLHFEVHDTSKIEYSEEKGWTQQSLRVRQKFSKARFGIVSVEVPAANPHHAEIHFKPHGIFSRWRPWTPEDSLENTVSNFTRCMLAACDPDIALVS